MLVGAVLALMATTTSSAPTTGNDVLYQAMKSVRTAFVIGTLATVATLPFAVVLGILAGYFPRLGRRVIQYLYTMLSSVAQRAAHRRLRADGAGVPRQNPTCSRPAWSAPT